MFECEQKNNEKCSEFCFHISPHKYTESCTFGYCCELFDDINKGYCKCINIRKEKLNKLEEKALHLISYEKI